MSAAPAAEPSAARPSAAPDAEPRLVRELGKWNLTALGINQVIGSAVYILPSQVAAQLGGWSPLAFIALGAASLAVALCFAELGSRFERTGGLYLYARAAFGPFIAFEVGWLQWFTRITAMAGILNAIALALGFYRPALTRGAGRVALIAGVVLTFGWINFRGVRQSALAVNVFTISKLVPLAVFVVVGIWFIDPAPLVELGPVAPGQLAAGSLLLVFAFAGFDAISVPSGESRNPRRDVPFALVATLLAVTAIMALVQVVALGTLPDLAGSSTPVADAARRFLGSPGGLLITVGSVVSMTGNTLGQFVSAPRILFAMAENGDLPQFLSYIHPRYRTPSNAIAVTVLAGLALALSSSFTALAVASALARLIAYAVTCAGTLRLREPRFGAGVEPASFTAPLGSLMPAVGMLVSLLILVGASSAQLVAGGGALLAGALLFAGNARLRRA